MRRLGAELKKISFHILVDPISHYVSDHCHQSIETCVSSIVQCGVCDGCPNSASLLPHLQLFTQPAFLQLLTHVQPVNYAVFI